MNKPQYSRKTETKANNMLLNKEPSIHPGTKGQTESKQQKVQEGGTSKMGKTKKAHAPKDEPSILKVTKKGLRTPDKESKNNIPKGTIKTNPKRTPKKKKSNRI